MKSSPVSLYLAVIHRLDQPVEGILFVFGKNQKAAASPPNRQLNPTDSGKHYLAWLCGSHTGDEETSIDHLVKTGVPTPPLSAQKHTLVQKKHGFIIKSFARRGRNITG